MVSDWGPQARENSHDNVFKGLLVGPEESSLVASYLAAHDFSPHTQRAIANDLRKFVRWFNTANREAFAVQRVTLRDVTDCRNHLQRDRRQAVASVNRAMVSLLRLLEWPLT